MTKICSICQISILPDERIKSCEKCQTEYHDECWNENGGCGTYGCEMAPVSEKGLNERVREDVYWGAETKVCPMCGETIKVSELSCPYCKEQFSTIAPISSQEVKDRYAKKPRKIEENKGAIIILIFGLLGITAPFTLIFGGIWYNKNGGKLREASPIHNLLAIVGLLVSVFYTILILIGILSSSR